MSSLSRRTITSSSAFLPRTLHAAREAIRVEQLEERREAVRVAVVRRGREEQPVLEAAGEVAHGARELRLDAVAPAARWRRVVRLVEDEQAARQQRPEPLAHRVGVGRVDQQVVRDQEAAVRAPRVHAEAALAPHPRQVGAVEDLEDEAEALLELALPLLEDRRRRRDDDRLRPSCAGAARGRSGRPRWSCRGRCRRR